MQANLCVEKKEDNKKLSKSKNKSISSCENLKSRSENLELSMLNGSSNNTKKNEILIEQDKVCEMYQLTQEKAPEDYNIMSFDKLQSESQQSFSLKKDSFDLEEYKKQRIKLKSLKSI